MSALDDALAAENKPRDCKCKSMAVIGALAPDDRATLLAAFERLSDHRLARALKSLGHDIGPTAMRHYREKHL